MKRIEDAPKELQKVFWDYFEEEFCDYDCSTDIMAHLFLKGFDTAIATGGLPEKRKRKIAQLIKTDQGWFSLADTGEWFYLVRPLDSECHWVKYPDLPQD